MSSMKGPISELEEAQSELVGFDKGFPFSDIIELLLDVLGVGDCVTDVGNFAFSIPGRCPSPKLVLDPCGTNSGAVTDILGWCMRR